MTDQELWEHFLSKKVAYARPFYRDFIWVTREEFDPLRSRFVSEFNIMQAGQSYRSKGYFAHIHAVEQGDYVFLHKDTGNIARFFPLGILHLIVDVIPYTAFSVLTGKRMRDLFARPQG